MRKNTASQNIGAQLVSATDGSAFTGSVTVYVTGDAGTQAQGSVGSGACTHEGNGYHTYAPAQAETNYDLIAFTFTGTGAIPVTVQVFTTANLVDDVWDETITGADHNVQNSSARFLREGSESNALLRGTAQSGTASTIVLESGAITADDLLNGERVAIIEGTGVGQSRLISDSVALSDTVTVSHNWTTTPDNTSVYAVMGAEADIRSIAEQAVSATGAVDFDDLAAILLDTNSLDGTKIPDTLSLANINAEVDTAWTTQMADSVATDGTISTREQALYAILQFLTEGAYSGTTMTVKKVDGSTTLMTFTLDDATNPTSITRAT